MRPVRASRVFSGTPDDIFGILSDPVAQAEALHCIDSAELIGDIEQGAGMRFRETQIVGDRNRTTDFEITEWSPPTHLRIVCEEGGTVWDSSFDITEHPGGAQLVISMTPRTQRLLPRVLNPLMKPLFRRGLSQRLDALEQHFSGASRA